MVTMSREDATHALRVLRLTPGDVVELICPPMRALAAIADTENQEVLLRIEERLPSTEMQSCITLYQGLPKADKMEWIIQKGTELGCARFVPVVMKRSIAQSDHKNGDDRKTERLRKIAREAVKQCGRCQVPEIMSPVKLSSALEAMQKEDILLVPWEEEHALSLETALKGAARDAHIGIVIGPEGGIATDEIDCLRALPNTRIITLGPRILRTETAAIASIAATGFALGEW